MRKVVRASNLDGQPEEKNKGNIALGDFTRKEEAWNPNPGAEIPLGFCIHKTLPKYIVQVATEIHHAS